MRLNKPKNTLFESFMQKLNESYKPVQDMWEGPGTYYISAKEVTGSSVEDSYDISDKEQFKRFLKDHPEYIEHNCKGYLSKFHTHGTSSYSGEYWKPKNIKESDSYVEYEVWQKYYDEDGSPAKPEYVQSFDSYEKAQKFCMGLNRDPNCEAWIKERGLKESGGVMYEIPDLAKEYLENEIYDDRACNLRSVSFHEDTLVVEPSEEPSEELFDKVVRLIEKYFKSYGIVADGGIEDDGNKIVAIDCFMTEEGYKQYLENSEEEDESVEIDGEVIHDSSEAKIWLDEKIREFGNTHFFPSKERADLNKLIEKFGNTYFWK